MEQSSDTRQVTRLIATYSESHLNPTNEVIHFICVPVIVFSFLGLIWALHPLAAVAVTLLSLVYYVTLSTPFALGMLLMSGAMLVILFILPLAGGLATVPNRLILPRSDLAVVSGGSPVRVTRLPVLQRLWHRPRTTTSEDRKSVV